MSDTEVHDEVDRSRGVRKESRQLDVSTSLTSAAGHPRDLYLGGCVEEVCASWSSMIVLRLI